MIHNETSRIFSGKKKKEYKNNLECCLRKFYLILRLAEKYKVQSKGCHSLG